MKNLFFLSVLFITFCLAGSCKKSDAGKVSYQTVDSLPYQVNNGTISITTNASTKVTYTAPEDDIQFIPRLYYDLLSASKKVNGVNVTTVLYLNRLTNGKFLIEQGEYYTENRSMATVNGWSKITVTGFNNAGTGVLMNAEFSCIFGDPNNVSAQVPAYGTINLKLNKK